MKMLQKLTLEHLTQESNNIDGIDVLVGRSGHVVGGIWFEISVEGKKIFYSGDIVAEPMLLK